MKTKIFCDIADINQIRKFDKKKIVKGFTTNPSLMRKAGAKKYSNYTREIIKITKKPISCEVFADNAKKIDQMGILQATFAAMVAAAKGLCDQFAAAQMPGPAHALVDGNLLPPDMPLSATALVKGDSRSLSIAAASIIAKKVRDQIMCDLDAAYPGYGWASNMGYGTKLHQVGLDRFGITPHHRKSFKPIRRYLSGSD